MTPEDNTGTPALIMYPSIRNAYLLDGHPLFNDGYSKLLASLPKPPQNIFSYSRSNPLDLEALENCSQDLVLLDIYNIEAGLELFIDLRINVPELKIIIMTDRTDQFLIEWCLALGVSGFIPKSTPKVKFIQALKRVINGERWTPETDRRIKEPMPNDQTSETEAEAEENALHLTQKEITTLKYLVLGMVNKDIADKMNVTESTTKSHVSSIIRKLGVINRTQVFMEYQRLTKPDNRFIKSLEKSRIRHAENA